jgi:hypothetical protein
MFHCTILVLSLSSMLGNVPSGPFSIQLGTTNQENGRAVSSGGDGTNSAETAGGSSCRRVTGERSHYFGLDFGFEAACDVTAEGNVVRLYGATASGGHSFLRRSK